MSGRRAADRNRIRGPQSALTDFLAANNISAQQIRLTYEQRNRAAQEQNATQDPADPQPVAPGEEEEVEDLEDAVEEQSPQSSARKRKRTHDKSKGKDKAKAKGKKKKKKASDDEDSDDEWDTSALARDMYKKAKPNPGQLENCELCDKRFTVTAYSKTGPDGGLVCGPCGRELAKDDKNAAKKPKKAPPGKNRRKTESNRLDGIVSAGPKTLQQLCIEKVADHHLDIDEFGDLPDSVMNRLSEIFSKRRVLNPRTVGLFLRSDLDEVAIHDCANLEVADYQQIFAVVPKIKKLVLRNACQFKDTVVEYMLERAHDLSHFQVYAANLITNDVWKTFFQKHGHKLEVLKLTWLDACFDDDVVSTMVEHCPNLVRLKLKYCRKLTTASFPLIASLKKLAHLSLQVSHPAESEYIIPLVTTLGNNLKTLSLENCVEADDEVVDAIRSNCGQLSKLRLSNVDCITDAALTSLFAPTSTVPPLTFLDVSGARDVDNNNPNGPEDNPIGLGSTSFRTLMSHHGPKLNRLDIASCRHVSHDAFWDVFIGNQSTPAKPKSGRVQVKEAEKPFDFPVSYPELQELNVSFCNSVDTSIINGIFKSCPRLKKVIAFGCFNIDSVSVPKGVALIGVPRAQDAIEQYGGGATDMEGFLAAMGGMQSATVSAAA